MRKLTLSVAMLVSVLAYVKAQSISVSGPTVVCPGQEYTYDINARFLFGQCSFSRWDIFDANGNHLDAGFGDSFTYAFDHPQNRVYTITVAASGGIACASSVTNSMQVTTKYPVPTISGPSYMCPGQTRTFTAHVNASQQCFHHKFDWRIPTGWTATYSGNTATVTASGSASNTNHTIRARVWYDDINTFGNFRSKSVWVGKPGTPTTNPSGAPTYQMSQGQIKTISVSSSQGATSYTWQVSGSIRIIGSSTGSNCTIEAYRSGHGNFWVTARNACGTSVRGGGAVNVGSSGGGGGGSGGGGGGGGGGPAIAFDLGPNPATTGITIELREDDISTDALSANSQKEDKNRGDRKATYRIYDFSGRLKSKGTLNKLANIDVSEWQRGRYILEVRSGKKRETRHIIVE